MLEKQNTADQEKTATGDAGAVDDVIASGAEAFERGVECYPGVDYPPGSIRPEEQKAMKQH